MIFETEDREVFEMMIYHAVSSGLQFKAYLGKWNRWTIEYTGGH